MPIPHHRALEVARTLTRGRAMAELKKQLVPIAEEVRPILPSVPGLRDPSAAATAERLCFAEDRAGPLPYLSGPRRIAGSRHAPGEHRELHRDDPGPHRIDRPSQNQWVERLWGLLRPARHDGGCAGRQLLKGRPPGHPVRRSRLCHHRRTGPACTWLQVRDDGGGR